MENNNEGMEKKIEREEEKVPNVDINDGQSDEEVNLVKDAKQAATDLKKENEIKTKLLEREEKLQARREALAALGGGSFAGQRQEKHIETPKEYKDRVLRGEI